MPKEYNAYGILAPSTCNFLNFTQDKVGYFLSENIVGYISKVYTRIGPDIRSDIRQYNVLYYTTKTPTFYMLNCCKFLNFEARLNFIPENVYSYENSYYKSQNMILCGGSCIRNQPDIRYPAK